MRAAVRSKTGKDLDVLSVAELTKLVEGAARKVLQAGEAQPAVSQPEEVPSADETDLPAAA